MQKKKNALLLIDLQNSFCIKDDGANKGELYVEGAETDCNRISQMIDSSTDEIDYLSLTQDSHHINDIAHPSWWMDKDGNLAPPFTFITTKNLNNDYFPRFFPVKSAKYIQDLESQGEFTHTIWPYHCLIGSWGHGIVKEVMDSALNWEKSKGKNFALIQKGEYPLCEHFGALRANIPEIGVVSTQLNQTLLNTLSDYERVFLTGQARTHCVANTLMQIVKEAPSLGNKLYLIEDGMSDVTGLPSSFYEEVDSIYDNAKSMHGVKSCTTQNMAWA